MPPFLPYCGIRGKFGLHAILLLSTIFAPSLASTRKQRRRLTPNESIAQFVRDEHSRGVARPEFTLIGERREKAGLFEAEQSREFDIDLVEANPAVTPETTYSTFHDGNKSHKPVGKSDFKFFVPADTRYTSEPAAFALIVINERTDEVHGIAQKNGDEMVTIAQKPLAGESLLTVVEPAVVEPPRNWTCGVTDSHGAAEESHVLLNPGARRTTSTANDDHHHKYVHDHDAQHEDGTGHAHAHSFTMNGKDGILPEIELVAKSLLNDPGLHLNRRQLYPTDSFPQRYTYQVDLYIEIDNIVVGNNGDLETAIQYVNAIVSAASSVYEREVDTHLHVAHIALTTLYDFSTSTSSALSTMKYNYASTSGWHYTTGYGIDLHHALLGKKLGGGLAELGAVCDSNRGFGVSGDLYGSLENIQFWDMYAFMHEVGHNFNSGHTHGSEYSPLIDSCGLGGCSGFPLADSATIMSYCHLCSGGDSNVMLTFGGYWIGGNRASIDNWINNPNLIGNNQYNPKRVPKTMYDYVSRLECVAPNFAVPEFTCVADSDCFDGNSCSVDKCNGGSCSNSMRSNCCGNGVCEVNEGGCSDCGPFGLQTPFCDSCYSGVGFMFDVRSGSSSIDLNGLIFRHSNSGSVKVYVATGSYSNHLSSFNSWTEVGSKSFTASGWNEIQVDFSVPIKMSPGETLSFFLTSSGSFLFGNIPNDEILASNDYLSILNNGKWITGYYPNSPGWDGYSWNGQVLYSYVPPSDPVPFPTNKPTVSLRPSIDISSRPSTTEVACTNGVLNECCGNGICEVNEESCGDCGPFVLTAPYCDSCYSGQGFMFDIEAGSSSIELTSMIFRHFNSGNVKVYTATGSYSNHLSSLNSWTEIASTSFTSSGYDDIQVNFSGPITMMSGETVSFYLTSTGAFIFGEILNNQKIASDIYVSILNGGRFINGDSPNSSGLNGYAWNGKIFYSVKPPLDPITMTPTKRPTSKPSTPVVTSPPTMKPIPATDSPTHGPTTRPSTSPTRNPTIDPTSYPTWDPTLSPVSNSLSPSTNPSSGGTINPTVNPTLSLRPSATAVNCVDSTQTDCCGNGVCEVNEEDCGDCGPFSLFTPECESCYVGVGFMFDVKSALSSVQLDGLVLWHRDSGSVTVYTASGTHINHLSSFDSWTEVASMNVTGTGWNTFQVDFNTPVKMKPAKTRSIFVTSTGLLSFGKIVDDTVVAYDDHLSIMNGGRYVSDADPSGSGDSGYAWEGAISYSLMPPIPTWDPTYSPTPYPTWDPTLSPTPNPTWDPTFSPTHDVPTGLPTGSPTASPTISPTGSPTTSPTGSPTTESPTESPVMMPPGLPTSSPTGVSTASSTESPTVDPTASPIVFPTASPTTSPTSSPTGSPTSSPTVSSTKNPTGSPISSPSSSPISSPTGTPTGSPTSSPISAPTGSPASPTLPTYSPTTSPTRSPVVTPTKSPTGLFTECAHPMWVAGFDYNQGDKVSFNDNVYTCRNKKGCDIRSPGLDNTWIFEGLCIPTAVPTPSPSTTLPTFSPTVEPTTSPTTLCGVPLWDNDANYSKGDQVVWFGGVYECMNKKTCDSFGPDSEEVVAWKYIGLCKETQSPTQSPSTPFPTFSPTFSPIVKFPTSAPTGLPTTSPIGCDLPAWVEGFDYNQGDKVSFNDYVYTCRNKKGCDIRSPGGDNTWIFEGLCIPTAVPTVSPSTALPTFSPTVEPTYAPTTTCGIPLWDNDANYSKGDQVVWFGGVYECMDKKKCDSFGPGSEEVVAWKYLGLCEETQSPTQSPSTPFPTFSPTVSPVGGAP